MKSSLLTLVFTDLGGSTALKTRLGDQEAGVLIRRHQERVRQLVIETKGREVDCPGDGFFFTFETPSAAVTFALRLQQIQHAEPELPAVRIGVHLGEVSEQRAPSEASKALLIEGLAVDLAGRIGALAQPGQILMSAPVFDAAQQRLRGQAIEREIRWRAHGSYRLKGIQEPVEIGEAGFEGISPLEAPPDSEKATRVRVGLPRRAALVVGLVLVAAVAAWMLRPLPPLGPIRSLAVLPLANLSGDPEQDYFADGLTEVLIGELAKIGSLRVISRTSVMQYKGTRKTAPEIAAELNVGGLVEGSAFREGNRIRITLQLIDARADAHIWAQSYERDLRNVLALQSEVAQAVAEQVQLELSPEEQALLIASRSVDPRAYDAYLRGLQEMGPLSLSPAWGPRARAHFERAVELDPDFAEAWVQVGLLRLLSFGQQTKAREAIERALELDDRLGKAHSALATIRYWYDWDFAGGFRSSQRAVQLSPNDPGILEMYVASLFWYGRIDEGLRVSEQQQRVAPLSLLWRPQRIKHLNWARYYERAIDEGERLRELLPGFHDSDEGDAYVMLGRYREAHRARIALLEQCGAPCDWQREALERGWAEGGREASLRAWIETASGREESGGAGTLYFALAARYTELGDLDEAFAWLERAYREHAITLIWLKWGGEFDPLRSDPRFDDLLRRIGYPETAEIPHDQAGVGWALAIQGRPAEAIAKLERAMDLSPSDPGLARWHYSMAMAHFAADRYE